MRSGLLAEFATPEALLHAVDHLREAGYSSLDAYTPFPVKDLEQKLGLSRSPLGWIVFPIGLLGTITAYLIMWYTDAISFPINVGGRPENAVPAFVPIMFETTVLAAGVGAFVLVFILGKLPYLLAPEFNVEGFERASIDRFWLGVDARDAKFELWRTSETLQALGADRVEPLGTPSAGAAK